MLQCKASILYKPLSDEIDYHNPSFPIEIYADNLILPNNKVADPSVWAVNCIAKFQSINTYILVPGTKFDIHGTRYGKGGGWYDRFLSKIPSEWLRIGVADKSQMSETQLPKQKWDEPVDWIVVCNGPFWSIHDTHARL